MGRLDRCYNVFDLREAAKRRLPRGVFEFVDRATEDEVALRNNRAAFERIKLRHRSLVDVSGRATKTTLFGKEIALPMAIAPTGAAGLCWHEGELELAKAAARAKIPFTLATGAMTLIAADSAGAMTPTCAAAFRWGRYAIWRMDSATNRSDQEFWHAAVDENNEWISNNC